MLDQLAVLTLTVSRLETLDIQYMLTGSVAAGWYGQPRTTRDIDIVAVLYPPHADLLAAGLSDEFECDADTMRQAIATLRPFTVFHRASVHKIDIIVRKNDDYEVEKFERRQRKDVEGQSVWVIAPEDLILSKLGWAKQTRSELQLRDVQAMITVQQDLDWAYIDRWAIRLTVRSLLAEMRR